MNLIQQKRSVNFNSIFKRAFCLLPWLILIAIFAFAVWSPPRPPESAAKFADSFFERLRAGEYANAYSMLSARKRKEWTQQELQKRWHAYEKRRGFVIDWKLESWQVYLNSQELAIEDQVLLDYSVRGGLRTSGFTLLRLKPSKNTWVVDDVRFEMP